MKTTTGAAVLRRVLGGVFATCVVAGAAAALTVGPSATAADDPCAASEIARTIGSVATDTGDYLDSHPETNTALTAAAQQQQGPQALVAVKTYFDANPQARKDLQEIQQPLTGLTGKCKLPITLPQLLQMLQGAQQNLGAPGASALPVGLPSPALPAATGPLPGPAATAPVAPVPAAPAPPVVTAPVAPSAH